MMKMIPVHVAFELSEEHSTALIAKAQRLGKNTSQVVQQLVEQSLTIDGQNVAAHGPTASPDKKS